MKKLLIKFWNETLTKPLIIASAIVGLVFTCFWSYQDGAFNPVPIYCGIGVPVFVFICYYLFRNNP